MCRTVADAVYLLDATTGVDPKDAYTSGQVVPNGGFAQFLQTTGLQGGSPFFFFFFFFFFSPYFFQPFEGLAC
jgi:hypothetical protein